MCASMGISYVREFIITYLGVGVEDISMTIF